MAEDPALAPLLQPFPEPLPQDSPELVQVINRRQHDHTQHNDVHQNGLDCYTQHKQPSA